MDIMAEAWERFLRTGRVSDYHLYYCRATGMRQDEQDIIDDENGEYPDANEYTGRGDRRPGY